MHIREDILALYGFLNPEEIDMFKKLISVNGVGPKAGLSVLSTNDITSIKEIILKEDIAGMSKVPGIGKKTASKIILELKDKVGSLDEIDRTGPVVSVDYGKDERSDIIDALVSLGFALFEVKNVIDEIDRSGKTENDIIKEALKKLNRKV
jgi:Holliday junction DNA helicase RuvA